MKTSLAALFFFSPFCSALVGISWSIPIAPSSALRDVVFPINITGATHTAGYFFAQQDVGYIGLQPRPDAGGKSMVHATFSSFVAQTTTTDPNCYLDADGGPGVSCATDIAAEYDDGFYLHVENEKETTWVGNLVDLKTQQKTRIGSWTLPAGTGGISPSQVGFVEYYPWNSESQHSCSSLPYSQGEFGNVFSTSTRGTVGDAYEYGDCVGEVAFKMYRTSIGVNIRVGF
ncbi:hypothetical protein BGZ63DRAFT_447222 [Mariannaea sp. PMI_226]|nr:hypothetical protein BGZ63DRAFT_447222 [Mariannaea sp. PMI_226]